MPNNSTSKILMFVHVKYASMLVHHIRKVSVIALPFKNLNFLNTKQVPRPKNNPMIVDKNAFSNQMPIMAKGMVHVNL